MIGLFRGLVCGTVIASLHDASLAQTTPDLSTRTTTTSSHRIVTLAPHLAQLAHAAGAGDAVVGVSEYTHKDYAQNLASVGNAFAVNWQQLAALKPTLVLVWGSGTPAAVKAKLKALGLATFQSEPATLADIVKEAQQLSKTLDLPPNNVHLSALQAQFERLNNQYKAIASNTSVLAVFHPIWPRPLMTINGQHVISDALRYCGARNVFARAKGLTPTVSLQQVLREKPSVLIIAQSPNEAQLNSQWQPLFKAFPAANMPATVTVNGDAFHQPGPGLIGETIQLCEALKGIKQRLPR